MVKRGIATLKKEIPILLWFFNLVWFHLDVMSNKAFFQRKGVYHYSIVLDESTTQKILKSHLKNKQLI